MRLLLFVSVFILAASGTSGSKLEHPNFKLHGCYLRRGSGANLKFSVSSSEPMTIESCQKDCSRYTFRYFGVADGTYCFCGNTKPYPKVPLFRCDQKCPGNYYQICGGSNSMVVYEQPATLATASAEHPNLKLQGCYFHRNYEDENLKYRISTSESMTIESCQKDCSRYTFRYFGVAKTECCCGDPKIANKISLNRCNYRCPGNPKQICGGIFDGMVVYEQPATLVTASAEHPNFKLQGCYVHVYKEVENLKYRISTSESMTIESCQKDCSRYTFRYFGVARTECFCGDSKIAHKISLNRCNYRCPGNPKQICGGINSMVVYEQPATLVTASAEHPNFKLQGCYVHLNNEDENLKYRISTSESMTIESCQKDCSRYTYRYFGVANKTECYCGDSLRKEQTSNECNYRCPGNLKQICGGSEYMVVYEQPDILPAASAEHQNFKLEGCYFHYDDPSSNLRRYKSSNESMTIESCQKDCSVTTDRYFGVISGTHCYCGDLIMSAQLSLKKCDYRCPGNPKQICGGSITMVVYEQPASAEHPNFKLQGCYLHSKKQNNLRLYISSSESMTIESCRKDCSVTTTPYFGVISGTYCYCGDSIMGTQLSLRKCDYRCPGNPEQICGGFDSMVVYEQLL